MPIADRKTNVNNPEFLAEWEPHRHRMRPRQCHLGERGICWVKEPYKALDSSHQPACRSCGGTIGEWVARRPPGRYRRPDRAV